jgi:hypothetical protein
MYTCVPASNGAYFARIPPPFLREILTHIFANFALLTHILAEVANLCVK